MGKGDQMAGNLQVCISHWGVQKSVTVGALPLRSLWQCSCGIKNNTLEIICNLELNRDVDKKKKALKELGKRTYHVGGHPL